MLKLGILLPHVVAALLHLLYLILQQIGSFVSLPKLLLQAFFLVSVDVSPLFHFSEFHVLSLYVALQVHDDLRLVLILTLFF